MNLTSWMPYLTQGTGAVGGLGLMAHGIRHWRDDDPNLPDSFPVKGFATLIGLSHAFHEARDIDWSGLAKAGAHAEIGSHLGNIAMRGLHARSMAQGAYTALFGKSWEQRFEGGAEVAHGVVGDRLAEMFSKVLLRKGINGGAANIMSMALNAALGYGMKAAAKRAGSLIDAKGAKPSYSRLIVHDREVPESDDDAPTAAYTGRMHMMLHSTDVPLRNRDLSKKLARLRTHGYAF